ncbi:MAG: hypothetical protein IPL70_07980 [Uliginosibacterium sp.]|jgi:hypothetical protein|nr:hypothetical protein [Uliginosibacterium sp.]
MTSRGLDKRVCLAIQTVADAPSLRKIHGLPADLSDFEVAEYALQRLRANGEKGVLPPYLQRIEQIALVCCGATEVRLTLLSEARAGGEREVLRQLADLIPQEAEVFCWGTLDPAILRCRALHHELASPKLAGADVRVTWQDLQALAMGCPHEVELDRYGQVLGMDTSPWLASLESTVRPLGNLSCARKAVLSMHALLRYELAAGQIEPVDYTHALSLALGLAQ